MREDHAAVCAQYDLALRLVQLAADLAEPTPEPEEHPTAPYMLSWRRYCQEAAHDLESAARTKNVSDSLTQLGGKYYADTRHPGNTDDGRGRAAAAKMLMQACQDLSQAPSNSPVNPDRKSGHAWRKWRPWGKQAPADSEGRRC